VRRGWPVFLLALPAVLAVLVGCGGSTDAARDDAKALVRDLTNDIRAAGPNGIVIRGLRSPRLSGPYAFKPGGYVLRFRQEPGHMLLVTLKPGRKSRAASDLRLVATRRPSGRTRVPASGRLYVHVVTTSPSYVLRFTPERTPPATRRRVSPKPGS
jgi:hypothetical protein